MRGPRPARRPHKIAAMAGSTIGEVEESLAEVRAAAARMLELAAEEARLIEARGRAAALEAGARRIAELRALRAALAADLGRIQGETAALVETAATATDALALLSRQASAEPAPWAGLQSTIGNHLEGSS